MSIATIGLLLIALAWIIQLVFSFKGDNSIQPLFILCYMAGVVAMVVADYMETNILSIFEFFTFAAAGLVLVRTLMAKK